MDEVHFSSVTDTAHNASEMRRWKRRSERVAQARKLLPAAIAFIVLNQPFVTMGPMRMSAKTGVYRPDQGTLQLEGEVVFDDGRNHLTTQHALFDVKLGEASGSPVAPGDGVNVTGQVGQARADGFHVYNSGRRIELNGNVRGLMQPHRSAH